MPNTLSIRLSALTTDNLELASGLSAVTAGVLWFQIYLTALRTPELCHPALTSPGHCAACAPAIIASGLALAGGAALAWRSRRPA